MYRKTYEGIIRSHFGINENGELAEADIKVKPLSTADLALKVIEV